MGFLCFLLLIILPSSTWLPLQLRAGHYGPLLYIYACEFCRFMMSEVAYDHRLDYGASLSTIDFQPFLCVVKLS